MVKHQHFKEVLTIVLPEKINFSLNQNLVVLYDMKHVCYKFCKMIDNKSFTAYKYCFTKLLQFMATRNGDKNSDPLKYGLI